MPDIKFKLPASDVLMLSVQTVNKLLRSGDSDAGLLYLYILKTKGESTMEETMAAMGKGMGWINSAMATLSRIGLIHIEKDENEKSHEASDVLTIGSDEHGALRKLSTDELKRELEAGSPFSVVVEETQKSLGKILSPDELSRLFGIYDHLNMPTEVIMQLVTYCIGENSRNSQNRVLSMRFIEQEAYKWAREGIMNLDRVEEHIKAIEARRSIHGEIKSALKIWDREFSPSELKYVDSWIAMGFDSGAVEIAHDRTLFKTGKLSWQYMDSIMQSWHSRGLHSKQEIMDKDPGTLRSGKNNYESKNQAPNVPNQEEIEYMQRILDKTKNT